MDETISLVGMTAPGRGETHPERLKEHLRQTAKRLQQLKIQRGDRLACALPDGPDAITAALAADFLEADLAKLPNKMSRQEYEALLYETNPKLLLIHSGDHPAREAARSLEIPVANVLRHFEAGIFTLEADLHLRTPHPPGWKIRGVPLVLIAPDPAYRHLAHSMGACNPVVGITPPSLEHLPLPHTVEHIAAECIRMLRRVRPHGPYALAGRGTDSLVALEMARLLEEQGHKVIFVAMLDASALFRPFGRPLRRAFASLTRIFHRKIIPSYEVMADALRQYRPRPWYGRILHIWPPEAKMHGNPWLDWRDVAPHGVTAYPAPAQMLSEPRAQTIATILASELVRAQ
jgi:hypothetical protein